MCTYYFGFYRYVLQVQKCAHIVYLHVVVEMLLGPTCLSLDYTPMCILRIRPDIVCMDTLYACMYYTILISHEYYDLV